MKAKLNIRTILGGSFDPVHLGHLSIANDLIKKLHLNSVEFMPCFLPVHRYKTFASASQRLSILQLAIANHPCFKINDIELKRKGLSYSIDTLIQLKKKEANEILALVIGEDVFAKLDQWHRWGELLNYCHLMVVNRPGVTTSNNSKMSHLLKLHQTENPEDLELHSSGKIIQVKIDPIASSATEIRSLIKGGKISETDLPETVKQYIQDQGLYI